LQRLVLQYRHLLHPTFEKPRRMQKFGVSRAEARSEQRKAIENLGLIMRFYILESKSVSENSDRAPREGTRPTGCAQKSNHLQGRSPDRANFQTGSQHKESSILLSGIVSGYRGFEYQWVAEFGVCLNYPEFARFGEDFFTAKDAKDMKERVLR